MKRWIQRVRAKVSKKTFFHLHLISDSMGETLSTTGRAAAQYTKWSAVEHVTPMVRTAEELAHTRRLCKQNNWPMIDVSKQSVEETAAAILALRRNGS